MKSWKRVSCCILGIAMAFTGLFAVRPLTSRAEGDTVYDVWIQNSADRAFDSSVMPDYPETQIRLYAARNEYEAAQVLVRGTTELTGLHLEAGALTGETGEIGADHISVFREYSVSAAVPGEVEPTPDGSDSYTDALLPNEVITQKAGVTQPYWVRIYVPEGQAPGLYEGTIKVIADQGEQRVSVSVLVYDVTIPSTDESEFKMLNWFGSAGCDFGALESSVPSQYNVKMYDENWWRVMESFARDLAIHRNNVEFIDFQALLMPDSSVDSDGNYHFDWSKFDRLVDIFLDAGALQYIYAPGSYLTMESGKSMHLWVLKADPNGGLARVKMPIYTDQANDVVDPAVTEYMKTLFSALRSHMQDKYPDLVGSFYLSGQDEPSDNEQIRAANWFYSEACKYYPELRSNEAHSRFFTNLTETSTLCPVLDVYENNQSYFQRMREAGKELWFYTCIGPQGSYLNRFIPYHLAKTRLIPWYVYQVGGSGYLHWGYCWWRTSDTMDSRQTGDEWLVRPDKKNYDVFTSVRNEAQLDGIEDFELLSILEKKDPDRADAIADSLIQSATVYSRSGSSVNQAHKALLDEIAGMPAEPVETPVFSEDFSSGYDNNWIRKNGAWSIYDGKYWFWGVGANREGMSSLRDWTLGDGVIELDLQLEDTFNNDDTMWGGITFRKPSASDTMWTGGYTLYLRKNGELELLRGNPFASMGKAQISMPEDGRVCLRISMNGDTITVSQAGSKDMLIRASDTAFQDGYISLVGTGANVAYHRVALSSYAGASKNRYHEVIADQSYQDSFDGSGEGWNLDPTAGFKDGVLETAGSTAVGLYDRIYHKASITFDMTLTGEQSAVDSKDYWGGIAFGKETPGGSIWDRGGYMLLLRRNGTVDLINKSGTVATGHTDVDYTHGVQVTVERGSAFVRVYLGGDSTPVLEADAPDYTGGFFAFHSDGGRVLYDNLSITGLKAMDGFVLLDDFNGDLGRWSQANYADYTMIENGAAVTKGVIVKENPDAGIAGKGVSPDLIYHEETFDNAVFSFDVRVDDAALHENWAGAFFHSGGTGGFWADRGYLVYVTNLNQLVLYQHGVGNLATAALPVDVTQNYINIQVELNNGSIKIYVNYSDQPVISASDEDMTYSSGYFGLMSDYADASFDNVMVKRLAPPEKPEEEELVQDQPFSDDFENGMDQWRVLRKSEGNWEITDGRLYCEGLSGANAALAMVRGHKYTNAVIDFDMTMHSTNSWAGISIRRSNPTDTIWVSGYFLYYDQSVGDLKLFKTNVGDVSKANIGIRDGETVHFTVEMEDNHIRVFVNGTDTPAIDYTDADNAFVNGTVALCSYMAKVTFDNFKIGIPDEKPGEPILNEDYKKGFEEQIDWMIQQQNNGVWTYENGAWTAQSKSSDYSQIVLKNRTYTDGTISFDMQQTHGTADKWSYCAFRRTNPDDGLWASGYFLFYSQAGGWVKLYKTGEGELGTADVGVSDGAVRHFKIEMEGNTFRIYVDDMQTPALTAVEETSVSENRIDADSLSGNELAESGADSGVSGNSISGNSISGNSISENSVSGNRASGNSINGGQEITKTVSPLHVGIRALSAAAEKLAMTCTDEAGTYPQGYIAFGVIDYAGAVFSNPVILAADKEEPEETTEETTEETKEETQEPTPEESRQENLPENPGNGNQQTFCGEETVPVPASSETSSAAEKTGSNESAVSASTGDPWGFNAAFLVCAAAITAAAPVIHCRLRKNRRNHS